MQHDIDFQKSIVAIDFSMQMQLFGTLKLPKHKVPHFNFRKTTGGYRITKGR